VDLSGVNAKLDRADEHLKAIIRLVRQYDRSHVNPIRVEFDGNKMRYQGKMAPRPPELPPIVGDCIHNFRSSLDHFANRLVEHFDGQPTIDTSFPTLKVPPSANKAGVSPPPHIAWLDRTKAGAVLAVVADLQPYTLGEDYEAHPLYVLNELWNGDKHRNLIDQPTWIRGAQLQASLSLFPPTFTGEYRLREVGDEGAVFDFVADPAQVDVTGEATLAIALGNGLPWEGQPILTVLRDLRDFVHDALKDLCAAL